MDGSNKTNVCSMFDLVWMMSTMRIILPKVILYYVGDTVVPKAPAIGEFQSQESIRTGGIWFSTFSRHWHRGGQ